MIQKLVTVLFFIAMTFLSRAQGVISDRAMLNTLLSSEQVDEDFEAYPASGSGAGQAFGYGSILSATNLWAGSGANLVVPGITVSGGFVDDPEHIWLQWNGNGYRGSTTRTVHTSYDLHLDFWNPTLAFGLDVKDFQTFRHAFVAGVTVYGGDDTTILYSDNAINISDPASGTFFGFQNPSGIGSVVFSTIVGDLNESPLIDNLTFSTAPIPEPSVMAFGLLGLGALTLRFRKM